MYFLLFRTSALFLFPNKFFKTLKLNYKRAFILHLVLEMYKNFSSIFIVSDVELISWCYQ